MNARVRSLYDNISVHATADREHEAVVELLLLVMVADGHISADELDEIRHITQDSGWESPTFSFDQYLGPAMAKVRRSMAAGAVTELLDDIDARITSTVLRSSVFSAARDVVNADDDVTAREDSLLALLAARFA